jgi:hypothetical protein
MRNNQCLLLLNEVIRLKLLILKYIPYLTMSSETASNTLISVIVPDSSSESAVNTNDAPPPIPIPEPRMPPNITPSQLTMPSFLSNNEPVLREPEMVSIQNVSFIENEREHHLSVPQQLAALALNTYDNPYDSNSEEEPFF